MTYPPPHQSNRRRGGTIPALIGLIGLTGLVLIQGCAVGSGARPEPAAVMPDLPTKMFEPAPVIPEFEEMLSLTEAQKSEFLDFFDAAVNRSLLPNKRVYAFLSRRLGNARFIDETLPAAQTIAQRAGNCMSLALATAAYAELVGVEVGWQLASTDPVYSSQGTVIYSANHIQTRLYEERFSSTSFSFSIGKDYLLIDYFNGDLPDNGTLLGRDQVVALVYQNLGVERLVENDLHGAFWYFFEGLKHDPRNWNLYNAIAIVYRRAGNPALAEALYQAVLDHFGDQLIVLRNFRSLLVHQQRLAEAGALEKRILSLPDPDPFPMIELGDEALEGGSPERALRYYERARDVAPYLHQIYFRMGLAYLRRNEPERAEWAFRQARKKAFTDQERQLYEAKMHALSEHTQ